MCLFMTNLEFGENVGSLLEQNTKTKRQNACNRVIPAILLQISNSILLIISLHRKRNISSSKANVQPSLKISHNFLGTLFILPLFTFHLYVTGPATNGEI